MKKSAIILIFIFNFVMCRNVFAEKASALITGTAADSKISGRIDFEDSTDGLKVKAEIHNVSSGKHGFHVHENGSCADSGKAAGGHFNPEGVVHGLITKDGFMHAHAGDLGNFEVGADGNGRFEAVVPNMALSGKYNVTGKAVILHEKEDDFGQPTGNAGGRIGCGVIEPQS